MSSKLNLICSCGKDVKYARAVTKTYNGFYFITTGFEFVDASSSITITQIQGTCGKNGCKPIIIGQGDISTSLPKSIEILPPVDQLFSSTPLK